MDQQMKTLQTNPKRLKRMTHLLVSLDVRDMPFVNTNVQGQNGIDRAQC